jgi:thiol-disulfide isomerase/thioredoxin
MGRLSEAPPPPDLPISVGAPFGVGTLKLLDGKTRQVVTGNRRATLLVIWATWCQYCKAEIPKLKEFYENQPPDGIELVAVNTGESPQRIKAFLGENDLPYLVAVDTEQKIMTRLKGKALPAMLLVDDRGIVRYVGNHLPKDSLELERALRTN